MNVWQARVVGDRLVNCQPRRKVMALQSALADMPQVVCPVEHQFAHGVYGRSMLVKAGTTVVGKIHREANALVIAKGECVLYDGDESTRIKAPFAVVSEPGTKRALHAITDTVVLCFHETDETDLEKIEARFIEPEVNPLLKGSAMDQQIEVVF